MNVKILRIILASLSILFSSIVSATVITNHMTWSDPENNPKASAGPIIQVHAKGSQDDENFNAIKISILPNTSYSTGFPVYRLGYVWIENRTDNNWGFLVSGVRVPECNLSLETSHAIDTIDVYGSINSKTGEFTQAGCVFNKEK